MWTSNKRRSLKLPAKCGLMAAAAWVLVLTVAFISYPKTDNLVTGILVIQMFGVDALGQLPIVTVVAIAIAQVIGMFLAGYLLGQLLHRLRSSQRR